MQHHLNRGLLALCFSWGCSHGAQQASVALPGSCAPCSTGTVSAKPTNPLLTKANMDREKTFVQELKDLQNKQQPEHDAFIEREKMTALLGGRTAVQAWSQGDDELANEAFGFILGIDELAIAPLLDGPLRDDPMAVSQAMNIVVGEESRLRRRIVLQLEKWLEDKRPVPEKLLAPGTEGTPAHHRVCDEAYVSMRRIVHFGDHEVDQIADADRFFNLPANLRDKAIARARASKSWRLVIDPESVDEPPPSSRPSRPKSMLGQ